MTFSSSFQGGHIFSTQHDAEHGTLTKNNTAQSFRNYLSGLNTQYKVNYRVFITKAGSQKDGSAGGRSSGARPLMSFCAGSSQRNPILQIFAGISVLLSAMYTKSGIIFWHVGVELGGAWLPWPPLNPPMMSYECRARRVSNRVECATYYAYHSIKITILP